MAGKINSSLGSGEECGKVIPAVRLPAQGQLGWPTFQTRALPQLALGTVDPVFL